jgi:hypothetical protein
MSSSTSRSLPEPDPQVGLPVVPAAAPASADPLQFPATTAEGITPLRTAALPRDVALRMAAERAAVSASPEPTPITVARAPRRVSDETLAARWGLAMVGLVVVALVGLVLGVLQVMGGLLGRTSATSAEPASLYAEPPGP